MKKKTQPKPTKVSKHNAPYVFQSRSSNLHPLATKSQNITSYQPQSSVVNHVSMNPSATWHPLSQGHSDNQQYRPETPVSDDSFSFKSNNNFEFTDGLSTDGLEIYESGNGLSQPSFYDDGEDVNKYREQNVRSAPATFPGTHQLRPIHINNNTIYEDDYNSQRSAHRVQISEAPTDDDDLMWIFNTVHISQQQSKPVPQSTAFLKNLSKSASGATADLPYENFLLRMVDNDLQHHNEFDLLEPEPEAEVVPLTNEFGMSADEEDEAESAAEENFWGASMKGGNKWQRDVAALTRGSLLALIDDSKHDTSTKHSAAAGVDFFQAAAAAAAAVGLDDMATKLAPKSTRTSSGADFFSFSPDQSRPESPFVATVRASSSGKEVPQTDGSLGKRDLPADWTGAFASYEDVQFDQKKVHRSKSMEAVRPKSNPAADATQPRVRSGGASRKNSPPVLKIEEFLKDIVDVEEDEDGMPFKTAVPSRRRSFAGITDFENSHHTSPKTVDKKGNVKYFSYLYKSQKKRVKSPVLSKNEDGLAMAVEQNRASNAPVVHTVDPFATNRSERRNSPPSIQRLYSSDSDDADEPAVVTGIVKPKPLVDLGERRFSSPSVEGPVWGQIPNLPTKPSDILMESRRGSPIARSTPTSKPASRAATPVIVGLIKKFSFEGEYIKSPFLHHMTKDKHLEKYGDAQRKQRQAEKNGTSPTSPKNANANGKAKSPKNARSPKGSTPKNAQRGGAGRMSQSTPALLEASSVKSGGFSTLVDKPRNPFLRQNSWERDPNAPVFDDIIQQKRPFAQLGSFDRSANSTVSELENGSYAAKSKSSLSRQSTVELDPNDLPTQEKPSFSRQGSFKDDFAPTASMKFSLSRQNSVGRDTAGKPILSRQPSNIAAERDEGKPSLSRQNSYSAAQSLPPIANAPVATTEMQSMINSINSVLVAPTPLKHSRPADVFSKGYASPGDSLHGNLSARKDLDEIPSLGGGSPLSRGSSFKNVSPGQSQTSPNTSTLRGRGAARKANSISPLRAGDTAAGLSFTTADNDSRPSSRPGGSTVSFAASAPLAGPVPTVSDTILQYVPSERRGSLSGEGMEEILKGVPKSTIIQRRKSSAGLLGTTVSATGNIDMLVSARRNSFISIAPDLGTGGGTNSFSFNNSINSEFSNPLMEEYYDAEEGLQDTGIIIANLHADPLYRILREEMERKEAAEPAVLHNTSITDRDRPLSGMVQGQQSRPQSSQHPRKLPPRPTRSANGLSNYKSRVLSEHIHPGDLKVLSTFHSLPPAVWVTCRVVYFLVLSFYETVPRIGKHYDYRSALNMDALWGAIEAQRAEYKLCMEELELQYSWPLLQTLLAKFPVQITKLLHAIEHGQHPPQDSGKLVHVYKPAIFFDAFPPTKLIYLRDLIKQGMGLFQSAELIHMIPVAAQMCDWSKRVIAQVYASCITRLRATQSNIKKVASVLHSTVAPYTTVEESLAGTSHVHTAGFDAQAPVVLPPNFKFVLAIEDALDEGALFAMHSLDSFSAFENSQTIFVNLSHTLEKGLNLVKPSDHLDLLLVPPNLSEISSQLSLYGGNAQDEFASLAAGSQEAEGSLVRIQSDWLLTKHNYERHLQQYAASPLHRVVLVPPPQSAFSSSPTGVQNTQQEQELQAALEAFYREQNPGRQQALSQQQDSKKATPPLFPLQALGVHPIVEHSLTSVALPISPTAAAKVSAQADIVITRLRNGKPPGFVKDSLAISTGSTKAGSDKSLSLRFSLVLIDDQAPQVRRPLSPFSAVFHTLNEKISKIDHAVASTVGPNKYVVCVADTPHSWLAFQMICRIAKPSDSITIVHIPVISPPFGGKTNAHATHLAHSSAQEAAYFTLREYKHQYERCQHRIDHLRAVYKSAGYNLLVDAIPTFQEEMHRQLVYVQRKNFFLAQLLQKQHQNAHKSTTSLDNNVSVRLFVQNQHTYHLATRLLAVTQKMDPSFLVLGAQGADILKVLTVPAGGADLSASQALLTEPAASRPAVRNLDFPYSEVVADNSREIPQLLALMSHHKTKKHHKAKETEHQAQTRAHWVDQFQLYADQRIDLVEMVLHQYANHCAASATSQALKTFGYDPQHTQGAAPAPARCSFILSNSDCLK